MKAHDIAFRAATLEEILPLRHDVIIAGTGRASDEFEGDRAETTRHYGAFAADGANIGCLTLMLNSWEGRPAWQLRGMATNPAHRGGGFGARLLEFAEQDAARESHVTLFWCNARLPAAPFYERQGWRTASDQFNIPGVGPHVKMWKSLQAG